MKFALSTSICPLGSSAGLTLREVITMALAADPVFEGGPQAGQPRPMSAEEIMGRVGLLSKLDGEEIELTAAQSAQLQAMIRTGLRAAFAVPACAFLEAGNAPV